MHEIRYELSEKHFTELLAFYLDQWWTEGRSVGEVREAVAGSEVTVVVDPGTDALVGFARIVTDGAIYGWVGDVMVDPSLVGQGVGRTLMEGVVSHPALARVRKIELSCLPEMDAFYGRFGFEPPSGGSHVLRRLHRQYP